MVARQTSDSLQVIFQDPVVPKVGSDSEPSRNKCQKRKASDTDLGSDNEPKRSRSERSTETLAREQQEDKRREKEKRPQRTVLKRVTKAGDPVVPKVGSDSEPSRHKCQKLKSSDADLGSDNEPKRSRSERSTETLAREQQEDKRREKEEKRPQRTALRVTEAGDQADFELKYEQCEELGEGGFGSVFAGVRISDRQPVAIKYIRRETARFVPVAIKNKAIAVPAEVLLMAKAAPDRESVGLNPTVSLLDWFNLDQGQIVLVMERPTPSEDLFSYCLRNAPLPEEQAKMVMQQVVEALVDLHSKRVFHRDIKMENLLVQTTESGPRIRIIDFGCSCVARSQPFWSKYRGTLEFAPPEYFKTKRYCAGPTSVWQVGALIYELLRSDDHSEFTTQGFVEGTVSAPSGLSQECCNFLQACLTVNPEQRIRLDQLSHHPWFSQ